MEKAIAVKEEQLRLKMGDMGELFGVVRQVSGELSATLEQSMTSVHFPERSGFMKNMAQSKELPDMETLETVWRMMLEELDESGNISRFEAPVLQEDGVTRNQTVVRVGVFGAVSDGDFLTYNPESGLFAKALQQPSSR